MTMVVVYAVAFAAFFYRIADYERMSPFVWGLASAAVTGAVVMAGFGTLSLVLAQVGLFAVIWWYNGKRKRDQAPP